jgi:hypothetical protein
MTSAVHPSRSQAWFPGHRYVPVRLIAGVEVFPRRRGRVRVGTTTIHGSTAQLRALAAEIVRAADEADAAPLAIAVAARSI